MSSALQLPFSTPEATPAVEPATAPVLPAWDTAALVDRLGALQPPLGGATGDTAEALRLYAEDVRRAGDEVRAVDGTVRGGYLHLGRASADGVAAFRGLTVG